MEYKHTNIVQPKVSDVRRFRAILLAKQRELLGNVTSMENETLRRLNTDLSSLPSHLADLATDNYELENTLGLVGKERNILVEIEDALERMQNGTYGICEADGEPMPRARLRAIPWARHCVKCASLNERGLLYGEQTPDKAARRASA